VTETVIPRYGSLFSGIGGMDLGLDLAGWQPAWQVEINEYRRQVLERHWPDVPRFTDVRAVGGPELGPVDLIAAGFPCQPFSVAGLNRGEADERNLWPETIRVIRAVRPRFALLENVPGLLAHRYFGRILGDLAEAGYDAEWFCIRASDFGAPHKRERLFIVADRSANGPPATERRSPNCSKNERPVQVRSGVAGYSNHVAHSEGRRREDGATEGARQGRHSGSGDDVADAPCQRLQGVGWSQQEEPVAAVPPTFPPGPGDLDAWARVLAEMPALEPAVCRVADESSHRVDRLAGLGDAVVPAVAHWIGSRMLDNIRRKFDDKEVDD